MLSENFSSFHLSEASRKKIISDAYLHITNAVIKQICKNREFPASVNANNEFLKHYLLQTTGLEKMMNTLSEKEVIALYFLSISKMLPNVCFFQSVYPNSVIRNNYYASFNQKYKDLYKEVTQKLICKGLIIPMFKVDVFAKSKIEQLYFYFPPEFANYLPPLLKTKTEKIKGIIETKHFINEIIKTIHDKFDQTKSQRTEGATFSISSVKTRVVQSQLKIHMPKSIPNEKQKELFRFITKILNVHEADVWFHPDKLNKIIEFFLSDDTQIVKGENICKILFNCNVLCKHPSENLYRPVQITDYDKMNPSEYARDVKDAIEINFDKIPVNVIEVLTQSAKFEPTGKAIKIIPSMELITRNIEKIENNIVFKDVCTRFPLFANSLNSYYKQLGEKIIHTNVLVAKVNDLSVAVMLEKKFKNKEDLVKLPDNYYAFPQKNRSIIEAMLKRSGIIVKEIAAS